MKVLLLSGGLDSLVLLAKECAEGPTPLCVTFDYGQRHRREIEAAERIAARYAAPWFAARLPPWLLSGSALTRDRELPTGLPGSDPAQAATVVPNRNMVFLSVAGSVAVRVGATVALFAAHGGDAGVYPDCRPEFVVAANAAVRLGCGVGIEAPFLGMAKREVVGIGRSLGVDFALSWSCYAGGELPCGVCGACVERARALES